MEKRITTGDGRTIHLRVNDDAVATDGANARPPIESDPDEQDEGATVALVLVNPAPNNMTIPGAIAAFGQVARHLAGPSRAQETGHWWHDWGKYVLLIVGLGVAFGALSFLGAK